MGLFQQHIGAMMNVVIMMKQGKKSRNCSENRPLILPNQQDY